MNTNFCCNALKIMVIQKAKVAKVPVASSKNIHIHNM